MRRRLFTLLVVPAAALLILASLTVNERRHRYESASTALAVAVLADEVASLDKALGDEALAGTKLLQDEGSQSRVERVSRFELSTEVTDRELATLEEQLAEFPYHPEVGLALEAIRATLAFRSDVVDGSISPLQILDRYSEVRGLLLDAVSTQALQLTVARSQQHILALIDLIEVRSAHLDERVAVQLASRYQEWAPGLHSAVVSSMAKQDDHLESANRSLPGAEIAPDPVLQAGREEIVISSAAPKLGAADWAGLSDAWIATLDGGIQSQRSRTTSYLAAVESSAARAMWATLFGVGTALVLAMLVAMVVSIRLVRRVTIITHQARLMAAGAPTSHTSPRVRGRDELGQLATAFDEMISHIDIRTRNQWIESSVLEAIVQAQPLEDIAEQTALLLGTDGHDRPLYRFSFGVPGDAAGDGELLIEPVERSDADSVPNSVAVRTAIGLVRMAQQRDADHAKLAHQASRDGLTGLLNRGAILGRVLGLSTESRVRSLGGAHPAGQASSRAGLLYVDLDDFKDVNDQFGHAAGDLVLVRQAARLTAIVEELGGIGGRLGGDEFLVVLPEIEGEEALAQLADRVVAELSRPIPSAQGTFDVGASVGAVVTRPDVVPLKLLNDADAALYQAKKEGRGQALLSTESLRRRILETERLRRDVLEGLEDGHFEPWFQPIWADGGSTLVGVEALARWIHPERGHVGPEVFLPVAEELNVLPELDRAMFEVVCRQAVSWLEAGHELDLLHYNLSTAWLEDPDFLADNRRVLERTSCPPRTVVAEVTESGLMTDLRSNGHRLQALRELGVRIAVDDFGQGYSSLAYLSDLPVDVLKIDRRFVDNIDREPSNQAIVSAVINLGASLGLRIVAEGVERPEELAHLDAVGCDLFQGYLLGRPAPAVEITALLGRSRTPAADGRSDANTEARR